MNFLNGCALILGFIVGVLTDHWFMSHKIDHRTTKVPREVFWNKRKER